MSPIGSFPQIKLKITQIWNYHPAKDFSFIAPSSSQTKKILAFFWSQFHPILSTTVIFSKTIPKNKNRFKALFIVRQQIRNESIFCIMTHHAIIDVTRALSGQSLCHEKKAHQGEQPEQNLYLKTTLTRTHHWRNACVKTCFWQKWSLDIPSPNKKNNQGKNSSKSTTYCFDSLQKKWLPFEHPNCLTSIKSPFHLGDFYGARTQQLQGWCPVDDDLTIGGDHRVQQGIHAGVTGPWMNQNHPILWWKLTKKGLTWPMDREITV